MSKRFLIALVCMAASVSFVQANDFFTIEKVIQNNRDGKFYLFVSGDSKTVENIFARKDQLSVDFISRGMERMNLDGVTMGTDALLDEGSIDAEDVLVIVDLGDRGSGIEQNHLDHLGKIVEQGSASSRIKLILASESVTALTSISRHDFEDVYSQLREQVVRDSGRTNYQLMFSELRKEIRNFDKVFLLSSGTNRSYLYHAETYPQLINRQSVRNSQIIPIAPNDSVSNTYFFEYLEGLNGLPLFREGFHKLPNRDIQPTASGPKAEHLCLVASFANGRHLISLNGTFEVSFKGSEGVLQRAKKRVVLSHVFDPMITRARFVNRDIVIRIAMIAVGFSLLLYYFIPLFNRFKLKQDHVFAYQDVSQDPARQSVDPLKLTQINPEDKVVVFEEKMMLLDSWKYLQKLQKEQGIQDDFKAFFEPAISGTLFDQDRGLFKFLYPSMGAFLTAGCLALLHYLLMSVSKWPVWELNYLGEGIFSQFNFIPIATFSLIFLIGACAFELIVFARSIPSPQEWISKLVILIAGWIGSLFLAFILNYITQNVLLWTLFFHLYFSLIISFIASHSYDRSILIHAGIISALLVFSFLILPGWFVPGSLHASASFFLSALSFFIIWGGVLASRVQESESLAIQLFGLPQHSETELSATRVVNLEAHRDYRIGRDPGADLFIKWDESVEDRHAAISFSKRSHWIESVGGPVFVNGEPVNERLQLHPFDEIHLGRRDRTLLQIISV